MPGGLQGSGDASAKPLTWTMYAVRENVNTVGEPRDWDCINIAGRLHHQRKTLETVPRGARYTRRDEVPSMKAVDMSTVPLFLP